MCRCSAAILGLTIAVSCSKPVERPAPPPPKVEFVTVETKDVPVIGDWVATLEGFVNAQIRAQVQGYLLQQVYSEGSYVNKGQLLFEIDPRTFQSALDQAKGALAQAQDNVARSTADLNVNTAKLGKTELDVKRYAPLVKTSAISQQEMDDAVQANLAAQAAVESSKAAIAASRSAVLSATAAVGEADLRLSFTRVVSPIAGIAGIAKAQVGDLVSPSSGELTTISTVDPIKAYFTVSEQEYLNYTRELERGERKAPQTIVFELILGDGTLYPHKGRYFATDRQIDPGTGAIRLAATFPNRGNRLRPGEFGRIRTVITVEKGVPVVPQRAISEMQGIYQVAVVGQDNKISIRPVQVGTRSGSDWAIREGLQAGERVVAEGLLKVRQGLLVQPVPFERPAEKR